MREARSSSEANVWSDSPDARANRAGSDTARIVEDPQLGRPTAALLGCWRDDRNCMRSGREARGGRLRRAPAAGRRHPSAVTWRSTSRASCRLAPRAPRRVPSAVAWARGMNDRRPAWLSPRSSGSGASNPSGVDRERSARRRRAPLDGRATRSASGGRLPEQLHRCGQV
jgi:hypothetical protein